MNKHFIQVTNGLVPVVVLLLLLVALIAGQARANLPNQATAAAAVSTLSARTSIILNVEMLRNIESLPQIVDTILALPAEIEITINTLTLPAQRGGDGEQKRPSAQ